MATTPSREKFLGKSVENVDSCDDNTNYDAQESSIGLEKNVECGLEPMKNESKGIDDSFKEARNSGLEPLTNDSDSANESDKE